MKRTINGVTYDTAKDEWILGNDGEQPKDMFWFEFQVYVTDGGEFYWYGNKGGLVEYPEGGYGRLLGHERKIIPLPLERALVWFEELGVLDDILEAFDDEPDLVEKAKSLMGKAKTDFHMQQQLKSKN